jgi:small subunit ribosomal protein S21
MRSPGGDEAPSSAAGGTPSPVQGRPLEVRVDERGIERALRRLRRVMATEGVLREIKRRRHYEKPSARRSRKVREAVRRRKRKS